MVLYDPFRITEFETCRTDFKHDMPISKGFDTTIKEDSFPFIMIPSQRP